MDCETTGLTDNDKILEVAMHITDMRGNTLMGTIHTIIHHEPDFFNDLDDSVINMHTNYTCVRGEIDRYRSYLDVFMPALESLNMK